MIALGTSVERPQCDTSVVLRIFLGIVLGHSCCRKEPPTELTVVAACSAYPGSEFTGVSLGGKKKSYKIPGDVDQVQCPENLPSKLRVHPMLLSL